MAGPRRLPLRDSAPCHLSGAVARGAVPDGDRMRVTVVIRPKELDDHHRLRRKVEQAAQALPSRRSRLTRGEFNELNRADERCLGEVLQFAQRYGLEVRPGSWAHDDVVLEGSVGAINRAFDVKVQYFEHDAGRYRAHSDPIHLPENLHDSVHAVLGLDHIPMMRSRRLALAPTGWRVFSPRKIASYYRFPTQTRGAGQRIAILAFAGGFYEADLRDYFASIVPGRPPRVRVFSVLGGGNDPLRARDLRRAVEVIRNPAATLRDLKGMSPADQVQAQDTIETTMDIQIAGAIAPGASIDVIFAPNQTDGYRAAILAALGLYPVREAGPRGRRLHSLRPANAISLSWGRVEAAWKPQDKWAIHVALRKAQHLGVTVCCASGDCGSRGTGPDERAFRGAGVSFPASSPYALACGGTTLLTTASGDIAGETTWNNKLLGFPVATGGGVSGFFRQPDYQKGLDLPRPGARNSGLWISPTLPEPSRFHGRGVPDVAADADAAGGYRILIGGEEAVGLGTSAATPLWAALVALLGERLGDRVGWLNGVLYRHSFRRAFRKVLTGSNDLHHGKVRYFRAHPGWDACTGLGSPIGDRLLAALAR